MIVRRRPTLPRPPGRSTIGAVGLNFQVRNGDWVFPRRYGHRNSIEISTNHPAKPQTLPPACAGPGGLVGWGLTVFREPYSGREDFSQLRSAVSLSGLLTHRRWVCVTSPRPISTSQLHTLPCFHFWPINPVVYWGPYPVNPVGDLILKRASRLDAFSGYHSRT